MFKFDRLVSHVSNFAQMLSIIDYFGTIAAKAVLSVCTSTKLIKLRSVYRRDP